MAVAAVEVVRKYPVARRAAVGVDGPLMPGVARGHAAREAAGDIAL